MTSLSTVHKEPHISELSLIPGAGGSTNISSTFGREALRLTGFTEAEFELVGLLGKLIGTAEPTLANLQIVERGLQGRLAKLAEIREQCGDLLEDYLAAASLQQRAAQPFQHFKAALQPLRAHVVQALGLNQSAVSQFFEEFASLPDTKDIAESLAKWKESSTRPLLSDSECDALIDFVLQPGNRHMEFSRERALQGVRAALPNYYAIPNLPTFAPENREEMKLLQWLAGSEADVLLQFFLHLNGESFRVHSSVSTPALAHLLIGEKVRQQVQLHHIKLGLARAFCTSVDDENWRVTIDNLTEKFEAVCIFAEAIGLEHSPEITAFVENFGVTSVTRGLHGGISTSYRHENSEHWWPASWLCIGDADELRRRATDLREVAETMPALEIKSRIEELLKLHTSEAKNKDPGWQEVENWV